MPDQNQGVWNTRKDSPSLKLGFDELNYIIKVVNEVAKFDFSHYAASSFQRRVYRVLEIYPFKSVQELVNRIRTDSKFTANFIEEVTVNTTELFRDPDFWREIRDKVLPELAQHRNIHIWHAGCSTGEEVYSMAITLKEAGLLDRVKITASDINETVLKTASRGHYPERLFNLYNHNYRAFGGKQDLSKYYHIQNGTIRMNPDLLANVKFRHFNLVAGDVFSKFDLILCRNVMIYFDKVLQDQVSKLFHNSLFKYGFLAVGSKESLIWCSVSHKFKTVSNDNKIYQARV